MAVPRNPQETVCGDFDMTGRPKTYGKYFDSTAPLAQGHNTEEPNDMDLSSAIHGGKPKTCGCGWGMHDGNGLY